VKTVVRSRAGRQSEFAAKYCQIGLNVGIIVSIDNANDLTCAAIRDLIESIENARLRRR